MKKCGLSVIGPMLFEKSTCIGETSLHLYLRYCEYSGVSPRTLKPVTNPLKSSIRDHSEAKNLSISISNCKVPHTCKSQDLRLSECILIRKLTAVPH